MSVEATIGEFLTGILPRLRDDRSLPSWPPDCFAVCLALLKRTGAYAKLLQDWPPDRHASEGLAKWTTSVQETGNEWRDGWSSWTPNTELTTAWQRVCDSFGAALGGLSADRALCEALFKLVVVADEASEGTGAPEDPEEDDAFLRASRDALRSRATLGDEIDPTRLRILPRMHTPQNGLTDRSLSLYLSLCEAGEVTPHWLSTPFLQHESLNLLLIPWPAEVLVSQFRDVTNAANMALPDRFGYFTYDISNQCEDLAGCVEALYAEAKRNLGRIDGVVLPELSLTDQQFRDLRDILPPDCFIVAGVGGADKQGRGENEVRLSFPPMDVLRQKKHHPWKLNESQIVQYGLGGVLTPSLDWWEYADLAERSLRFVAINQDLVICALVCEDLARPDPVANIVRTVGPNLVIALLMDGPQTRERWAARYATVLADDPGCSVLSLTSIGMARLSRPEAGPNRSNVVALWKDAFKGATEIELPPGFAAIAVSLSVRYREEFTADGRGDDGKAAFPILSGTHPIADPRRR
ncbi:MAG TPA: hypothetical protein VMU80_05250 [Bryobacteraceae bacterium]|nr:hypothetical protein [Bryobacteraceae bacterium]